MVVKMQADVNSVGHKSCTTWIIVSSDGAVCPSKDFLWTRDHDNPVDFDCAQTDGDKRRSPCWMESRRTWTKRIGRRSLFCFLSSFALILFRRFLVYELAWREYQMTQQLNPSSVRAAADDDVLKKSFHSSSRSQLFGDFILRWPWTMLFVLGRINSMFLIAFRWNFDRTLFMLEKRVLPASQASRAERRKAKLQTMIINRNWYEDRND